MTNASFSISKEIASLNSVFGEPFYERTSSNNTGSEVVSLSPPVTKDTYSGQGFIKGVGNVTIRGPMSQHISLVDIQVWVRA